MRAAAFALLAVSAASVAALAATPIDAVETRPTRAQAAASVAEYKATRGACSGDEATCDAQAKRRFVEVVSCVVHGQPRVDAATLEQDFTRYVDVVGEAMEAPEAAATAPGPCFARAAGAPPSAARPAGPAAAPPAGAASDGPSVEALRKFRKQAEEQSRPVTPLADAPAVEHEKLKADLEAIRGRLKSASPPGGTPAAATAPAGGGGFAPAPAVGAPPAFAAPTPPPAPVTGTTNISGGPSAPPPAAAPAPAAPAVSGPTFPIPINRPGMPPTMRPGTPATLDPTGRKWIPTPQAPAPSP